MSSLLAGKAVQLSKRIQRVLAPNPGVMPGAGTNSYLIGENQLALIDPGPAIDTHIQAILTAAKDRIRWILITHSHSDHYPAADAIKARTGATVFGYGPRKTGSEGSVFAPGRLAFAPGELAFAPDHFLADNQILPDADFQLRTIHTPGHASDHLCYYLEEEQVLFTGDQIMNGSTVVIAPPDGDMQAYLDSLDRLKTYSMEKLAPGHGEMMDHPISVIDGIIQHRLDREAKVIRALASLGRGTVDDLVAPVYDDVPTFLHPVARYSLLAHLIKLERDARATRSADVWSWGKKS
ncbi:MAG: MBL fold metallo-hydrolase [Desulfobacterales bacterium]